MAFAVIGIALAALVVGGIVISQRRGATVADSNRVVPQSEVADNKSATDKKSTDPEAKDTEKKAQDKKSEEASNKPDSTKQDEKKQSAGGDAEKKTDEAKKKEEEAAAARERSQPTPSGTAPGANQQPEGGDAASGPMSRTGGQHPTDLPETGPTEDLLMMTIGLLAIMGSGYAYYHFGRK